MIHRQGAGDVNRNASSPADCGGRIRRQVVFQLLATRQAPGIARGIARDWLRRSGKVAAGTGRGEALGERLRVAVATPEAVDDFMLVVTEIVTNAVSHTTSSVLTCRLQITDAPGLLVVEVRDAGGLGLRPAFADGRRGSTDEHGRGLLLVDALAVRWGASGDSQGHSVWACVGVGG